MTNYVLLFTDHSKMPETEAEVAAMQGAWGAWFGQLGASLVDAGGPINPMSAKVVSNDSVTAAAPETVQTGYTIVSAESIEEAVEKARLSPVHSNGGSITVLETIEM